LPCFSLSKHIKDGFRLIVANKRRLWQFGKISTDKRASIHDFVSSLADFSVQIPAGERIGDLPLAAKVARKSTAKITCRQAGGASRISSRGNPHSSGT
jgi:hypothetical protein